jgi:hypothetical protein
MPPPQFSRRRRRWVHAVKPTEMYCFTDAEITRGLQAVLEECARAAIAAVRTPGDRVTAAALLPVFLEAARPANVDAWPASHPMHCTKCGRAITDATGRALVAIDAVTKDWTCQTCRAPMP